MKRISRMLNALLGVGAITVLGLVSNALADSIYFTTHRGPDPDDAFINQMNLDGTGLTTVLTGASYSHTIRPDPFNATTGFPRGLALDLVNGKIYFTDMDERSIRRANLDGSNVELVVDTGLGGSPQGIALDVADGRMYWADPGFGRISRANLDGSNIETIIENNGTAEGIALGLVNRKIYSGSSAASSFVIR